MTFYVEREEGIRDLGLDCDEIFEKAARQALVFTDCPYECELSLTLTDDDRIRELNREHRGIDASTDVLSFPMLDFETPGDFSGAEESFAECFNPESGELMLGDIVISVDHVYRQAEEYGHGLKREFAFLIVHSMLHLQGFDHIKEADRVKMEEAQDIILDQIEITRDTPDE